MFFKKWIAKTFGQGARGKAHSRPAPARRFVLESLEDRTVPAGTWAALGHAPPASLGTMLLLTDGTVMAHGTGTTNAWYKLTPDANGSYVNGTWSTLPSMSQTRLYYGSDVLPDGRVIVLGGEYSSAGSWTSTGEIYNPVTNSWSSMANFPLSSPYGFGDGQTVLLPNGKILAGWLGGTQCYLWDPATNTWSTTGSKIHGDRNNEESWVQLPDGDVLSYDVFSSISTGTPQAQRYDFATGTWTDAGTLPALLSTAAIGYEVGGAILLPDGRVFQIGGNSNTALYNPATNTWAAGPSIPGGKGADDAPMAIMPNGHVIFTADTPLFHAPTRVFDYDPVANTLTDVTATVPAALQSQLSGVASYQSRMLMLPTGQMLLSPDTFSGGAAYVYTPDGSPDASWKPTITGIDTGTGGNYTLHGTQLTGRSAGAAYGDDATMDTNFPVVQLTATDGSGRVYYARTTGWTPGVATGSNPVTTQFQIPNGVPQAVYSVRVIASGIASDPFTLSTVPGLAVSSSTPASGSVVGTPPTQFVLNFNEVVQASSLQAGDLTVNGVAATGVSLDGTGTVATFTFTTSPVVNQGPQTIQVAAGAITGTDGTDVQAFTANFRYDAATLAVASTSPPVGGSFTIPADSFTYDVTFNEPIDPALVSTSNLTLSQGSVTGATVLSGNTTVRYTLTGFTAAGSVDIAIAAGALKDQYDNPGFTPFSGTYQIRTGLSVTASTPADGAVVSTRPTSYAITFDRAVLASSLQASDLKVNGVAATGVSLDGTGTIATFTFGTNPVTTQGVQSIAIAADSITGTDGTGTRPFTSSFYYDARTLSVANTTPPPNGVLTISGGTVTYDVTFNEAIDPAFVSTSNLTLSQGTVTGATVLSGNTTVRYTLSGFAGEGQLDVSIPAGTLEDQYDNPDFTAFSASYQLDIGSKGFPVPVAAAQPLGSLIYSQSVAGQIGFPGDTDAFTVQVDPGQTLTVEVLPDSGLRPSVQLIDPTGAVLGSATGSAAGQAAVLQTVTAATGGTYRVVVGGASSTTGGYAVRLVLNARAESEGVVAGSSNDTRGTAENLNSSFVTLQTSKGSAQRGAVVGQFDSSADYYSFSLAAGQSATLALAYQGGGGAIFHAATQLGGLNGPAGIATGDFNGDGVPDLVATNVGDATASVALGNGDGTFGAATTYSIGDSSIAWEVAVGDVNGDGHLDVLSNNFVNDIGTYVVSVLLGNGDGTFGAASYYSIGSSPYGLAVGDLNGDGRADVVTADSDDNTLSVLLGRADGTLSDRTVVSLGDTFLGTSAVALGDLDSNGTLDAVVSAYGSNTITTLLGDGTGGFGSPVTSTMGAGPWGLALVDLNGDGNLDVATANAAGTGVSVELGDGTGGVGAEATYDSGGSGPVFVAAGDVNGDGRIDLVVTNSGESSAGVLVNDGTGAFTLAEKVATGLNPYGVKLTDLNGDGLLDVTTADFSNNTVSVALNASTNIRLEILDAGGNVLATGSPTGDLGSVISNFVAPAAGTYYARLTGAGASAYSLVATRGAAFDTGGNDTRDTAQSLDGTGGVLGHTGGGGASALFDLSGTTVNGPLLLSGTAITLGINSDGSFITDDGSTGIVYNGVEFVVPGSPVASFTVAYDGLTFTNNAADGVSEITNVTLEDISTGTLKGVRIIGMAGDLRVERVVAFNEGDSFVTIATRLTNLGSADHGAVATLENLDPDQDATAYGDYTTINDVVQGGQFVRATGANSGLTIGLGSADPRSVVSAEGFDNRNPFDIIDSPVDPNGTQDDIAIAQAFNFGTLAAGAQVSGFSIMAFGTSAAAADGTYASNSGGTALADPDWYSIALQPGQSVIDLETSTPADGSGEFVNLLDPHLELYDAAGTLVATGAALGDGRNEALHAEGLLPGGTYFIKVTAEGDTRGEYFLTQMASAGRTPDISMGAVTATGGTTLTVTYQVTGGTADPFRLGFYSSSDAAFDASDAVLSTVQVTDPSLLTVGTHTLTLTIGAGAGQVALPGAGAALGATDAYILAVANDNGAVTEANTANNAGAFTGAYHVAGGDVIVHGTDAADVISVTSGSRLTLTVNGVSAAYRSSDVTRFDFYAHAGDDQVTGSGVSRAMTFFNGSGNDTLTGGTGSNTLVGANGANAWALTGANAGTVNGTTFTNVANLTGGSLDDTFAIGAGATLSGTLDGKGGTNTLDYAPYTGAVTVNLQTLAATALSRPFAGINAVVGGTGSNTLTGANATNAWALTGANVGAVNGFRFANFQTLNGGTGADTFSFAPGGSASKIDGKTGTDALDYSAFGAPVTINLQAKTATGIATPWAGIEAATGTSAGDTLVGANATNTWALTGRNAGNVNGTFAFTGFANLTGGASNDTYRFNDGAAVTGVIDGQAGTNALDYSSYANGIAANLAAGTATGTGGIANVRNVTGGAGNDILVGDSSANALAGGGGLNLLIGGAGKDTLTAGSGGDILIAGTTSYDTNRPALEALFAVWTDPALGYASRVAQIQSGVNYTDGTGAHAARLTTATVFDDAAADTLNGGAGLDWYFARATGSNRDTVNNRQAGETSTGI